ncbi:hypothetical protein L7F22_012334 [Adiantum nelumboides]|nr:hypothetical protein [Adiantum nelumboides]
MKTTSVRQDQSCCKLSRKMSGRSNISSPACSDGNPFLAGQAADQHNSALFDSCKSNDESTTSKSVMSSRRGAAAGASSNIYKKKVRKRKSRAKPKAPIKELACADKFTFRDLVHNHTGLQSLITAPSEPSSFPAACTAGVGQYSYDQQLPSVNPACNVESFFNYNMQAAADPLSSSSSSAATAPANYSPADQPCYYDVAHPATIKLAATLTNQYNQGGELNVSPNNYLMLACVLLRHITSELYAKCILP